MNKKKFHYTLFTKSVAQFQNKGIEKMSFNNGDVPEKKHADWLALCHVMVKCLHVITLLKIVNANTCNVQQKH